ncbi:Uncharacterized protein HZ326_18232 [Fusarium oxysporum f. sp. albedinis]|nr:Uncharacterized protein HZ326_18232 [Fusarium oxysporum f. sp. albedinis]
MVRIPSSGRFYSLMAGHFTDRELWLVSRCTLDRSSESTDTNTSLGLITTMAECGVRVSAVRSIVTIQLILVYYRLCLSLLNNYSIFKFLNGLEIPSHVQLE